MENKKLEKMLDEMKANGKNQLQEEFVALLKQSTVVVPALMPRDTNPEIMCQLLQNPGKTLAIPQGANPQPCILEDGEGKKFLAIFTSETEMKKNSNAPKFPVTLNLAFENCIDLVRKNPEITGAVINPFTHNVIFRVEETKNQQPQTIQVTIEQFHHLTRQKMEAFYLPKSLFEQKAELIGRLQKEQGNCLKEMYEELYDTEVACPYVPEDFEFMCLNISEELLLLRITMPEKYLTDNTCPCVMVGWNAVREELWYYSILLVPNGKAQLHQRLEDGQDVNLGEAPAEGSELSTVIDLIQGAANEK